MFSLALLRRMERLALLRRMERLALLRSYGLALFYGVIIVVRILAFTENRSGQP
jgi:hypothetical protein